MATATSGQSLDYPTIVRKFMDPSFLDNIIKNVSEMFDKMNVMDRFLFSEYTDFIRNVKEFKESLLEFILESKIQLSVLKDNFQKPKYKQADEHRKVEFIKQRLDKKKETLLDYLHACDRLIQTSIQLHQKYGTWIFKAKYVALHLLGFTIGGAIAGFTIGLVLPFLEPIEMCAGALVGGLIGLGYVAYELIFNWEHHMNKIEVIRDNLKEVQRALQHVLQQMQSSYEKFGMTKDEIRNQSENNSFQDIHDLEQYVLRTLDGFIVLQGALSKVNTDM
ncbi:unnamed protein product [Rotaria socialis]|uniref:Uncharacterized protein n=1 Tax=Rotaria socialis TaxID=392032 RepID=A0A818EA65_9BILA|nr:unnamed protein product [Rotaria socialis]CAF4651559.1 unnamed protein product [Rotaria socialis]